MLDDALQCLLQHENLLQLDGKTRTADDGRIARKDIYEALENSDCVKRWLDKPDMRNMCSATGKPWVFTQLGQEHSPWFPGPTVESWDGTHSPC